MYSIEVVACMNQKKVAAGVGNYIVLMKLRL